MSRLIGLIVLALTAMLPASGFAAGSSFTVAPGDETMCRACTAIAHLQSCDRPVAGTIMIRGRVTGIDPGLCSQFIKFDPLRAAELGLPQHIRLDLGPCAVCAGRIHSLVKIAIAPRAYSPSGEYSLACRPW
jgi:hypothetical protein